MTPEDAYRNAIRAYFKGREPEKSTKTSSKRQKYNKKYFDRFEEDQFGSKLSEELED